MQGAERGDPIETRPDGCRGCNHRGGDQQASRQHPRRRQRFHRSYARLQGVRDALDYRRVKRGCPRRDAAQDLVNLAVGHGSASLPEVLGFSSCRRDRNVR
jgi:hypothetical protein